MLSKSSLFSTDLKNENENNNEKIIIPSNIAAKIIVAISVKIIIIINMHRKIQWKIGKGLND